MYASPDDADTATAACLEAADVNTEAFEWEWTAYKPGQGSGTGGPYYNAARYRCTAWSGGRPDGYNWQHAQNGQVAVQRTSSGTGTVAYILAATPVNTVTFNTTDKMAYRCVVFGDWHALYVNKNDTGFKQLYNVQDLNAGRKSSAGSVAFLSQRGQTKIAASTIWTFKNQDGNSGTGPVPFLYSLDSNGTATLPIPTPGVSSHRLLESGQARLLESGDFRLLESAAVVATTGRRLLEGGAARLLEGGALRLLEAEGGVVVPPAQAGVGVASYVQRGCTIDYIPGRDVDGGEVIDFGTFVGVSRRRIASGDMGALAVDGVFSVDKPDGEAVAFGVPVYWDDVAKVATGVSGGSRTKMGLCVRAALADDYKVRVKLLMG